MPFHEIVVLITQIYSKSCVKRPLSKRPKIGFEYQLSLNAGQNYCRMLQYFLPSIKYHLSLRPLFYLCLTGRFTQVLLFCKIRIFDGHFYFGTIGGINKNRLNMRPRNIASNSVVSMLVSVSSKVFPCLKGATITDTFHKK